MDADGSSLGNVPLAADIFNPGQHYGALTISSQVAGYWILTGAATAPELLGLLGPEGSSTLHPLPPRSAAQWVSFTYHSGGACLVDKIHLAIFGYT